MNALVDLTGRRFGRLVVAGRAENSSGGHSRWRCICDCSNETMVHGSHLKSGHSQSCSCLPDKAIGKRSLTHGHTRGRSQTPEYRSWCSMRARCNNPKNPNFLDYGDRGITICKRWDSFQKFLTDMGPRPPGKTLSRIDNDFGYEPSNCQWGTPGEQSRNTRTTERTKLTEHRAKLIRERISAGVSLHKIANEFGVSQSTVFRIKHATWRRDPPAAEAMTPR
jgi:hypothetical protein